MPVLSRCPLCRGVMPDSRGGEARCPRCGELVLPAIRKLCGGCGTDVTRDKRVRDETTGEYYCHDCWERKLESQGEFVGYVCKSCQLAFASDQVYQDGDDVVCIDCYNQRSEDPAALEAAAVAESPVRALSASMSTSTLPPAVARYRKKADLPWGLISFGLAVFVALVVTLVVVTSR